MTISPEKVWFDEDNLWVLLSDGRTIGAPLAWFPRLLRASKEELQEFELSVHGIHWDNLDEDISVKGLLAGRGDQTHPKRNRAA
ncbi:DUF2442 domain-containing protein [Marinobacter halophilus]|uniref:DUF2442 domain-containing protein n=1 Tax=Marinobacter halophilus TaxID=1323740 RepID=A0A2T1KC86_9GAMM|nr:DUF2442 domain-containing protein [Marinobacter halophilus]PSF07744.1 DUF2442 domain-containing protein [Marinobacter halophilus]GGC56723.1 hypothetical protein GCM10011362_01310 [Marinobacter halophilus]